MPGSVASSRPDWRIWYDDGSTFSSADGSPEDAPCDGVQVVVLYDPAVNGFVRLHHFDWYWWSCDGEWCGGDLQGYLDHAKHLKARAPKQGRVISTARWQAIYGKAQNDTLEP